jgi:hypothetical protein
MTENVSPEADLAQDEQSLLALAEYLGFPYVRMRDAEIDDAILSLIPAEFARINDIMPLKLTRSHLTVEMADPRRQAIFQALGFITGLTIDVVVATLKDVRWAVRHYYGVQNDELALESIGNLVHNATAAEEFELARLGSENGIVRR